jgi:hypothetical protein
MKGTAKEILGVAFRFSQTLLKNAPNFVSTDPVKASFVIAKMIIDIKAVNPTSPYLGHMLTIISGGWRQQGQD